MNLPQLKRQQVILISGIVLAIAAFAMLKVYLNQQRALTEQTIKKKYKEAQANQTPVLVAKKDIGRGEAIEPDSLGVEIIPNKFVVPQAMTSLDRVAGMKTIAPISKGEQITLSKLTQERSGGDLAGVTPAGKRAVTILVDEVSSFGGMIKAGNYVDIIGMVPIPVQTAEGKPPTIQTSTVPLFQNILVLAVGQNIGTDFSQEARYRRSESGETKGGGGALVTLALSPQEANIATFVQEQGGKIRLVLRSPTDAKVEPVQLVTWETLFQYLMPQELQKNKSKEELPPSEYVEIYRGMNKERMPLSK
ncbi:MAG: Flp pilus assembly protein CpaB [Candidatus Omnitrophota bacterium]